MSKVRALRDRLIEGLKDIPYSQLNGDPVKRLPGNVNWSFEGVEGESLLLHLDMYGIECSSGSACTSESLDPSHVLLGMGVPVEAAHGSLRFSLDIDNTEEQIDYVIEKVHQVVEYYRSMSPYWEDLLTGKREHCIPEFWNKYEEYKMSLYTDKVMDHFENPRNVGVIEDADGVGEVGNPVCGDIMKMYLKVEDDKIADVKFKTFGCGSAIATSSMATELIKGKSLDEALELTNKAVVDALDGLPARKIHCSVLAEDAIKAALVDYYTRSGREMPESLVGFEPHED
jgi:FeS cluster assembly scaffold protein NifU